MTSEASNWCVDDVGCWLVKIGLGDYAQNFKGEYKMSSYSKYITK